MTEDSLLNAEYSDSQKDNVATDSEFETLSVQEKPPSGKRKPLDPWILEIIQNETKNIGNSVMEDPFLNDHPNFDDADDFFKRLNGKIRAANREHNVDAEKGVVPIGNYRSLYESSPFEEMALAFEGDTDSVIGIRDRGNRR
jgi:hypothetical protein